MERQKRTSLAFTIVLFSISCAGCFVPIISFDPPPFLPVESNALPKRVDKAFSKAYPTAAIQRVDSLIWPPSGEEHFRITFLKDGELMEARYRQNGKELGNFLRQLEAGETNANLE